MRVYCAATERLVPKVSLTLPTYNGARYLREAIESILAQSFGDFEIDVVVDGSTDGTRALLDGLRDPRIRVIEKPRNEGLPAGINTGLDAARGEYWAWTSDDNLYLPDALKVMVEHLDANPGCMLVSPFMLNIDPDGRTLGVSEVDTNCFLCRRQAAIDVGRFRTEYMLVEDADFFLRMKHRYGAAARIRSPHYKFRVHPKSQSSTQIQKRQLVSTKLHYDLITRGIEEGSIEELFYDRLKIATLFRGWQYVDQIVDFAREKQLPFYPALRRRAQLYKTPIGWLWVKGNVAIGRRLRSVLERMAA